MTRRWSSKLVEWARIKGVELNGREKGEQGGEEKETRRAFSTGTCATISRNPVNRFEREESRVKRHVLGV